MHNCKHRSFVRGLVGLALVALAPACEAEPFADSEGDAASGTAGDVELRIADPTPVPADQMLWMVRVTTSRGSCSGTLIARDTVLTAAHCFCTEDVIGDNSCTTDATVKFRDDPYTAGTVEPTRTGTATIHPNYNPSWPDTEFENDLAVIRLSAKAPAYVPPVEVATSNLASGATVKIAGYGKTGGGCNGSSGTLNYDMVTISGHEDSGKIIRFNDIVFCSGDSGGPVLNSAGTRVHGVHSTESWTLTHGWVNKSISVAPYYNWIKGLTCSSAFWDVCDDKGPICQCGEGGGDCDVNNDCKGSLECRNDVGALFGYDPTADVCLYPGPVQGTCSCGNSGVGNICTAVSDSCSPGFSPTCSSFQGNCGGCTCQ